MSDSISEFAVRLEMSLEYTGRAGTDDVTPTADMASNIGIS